MLTSSLLTALVVAAIATSWYAERSTVLYQGRRYRTASDGRIQARHRDRRWLGELTLVFIATFVGMLIFGLIATSPPYPFLP